MALEGAVKQLRTQGEELGGRGLLRQGNLYREKEGMRKSGDHAESLADEIKNGPLGEGKIYVEEVAVKEICL